MKKILFILIVLTSLLNCTSLKEIDDLKALANNGNAVAQYNLGIMYAEGLGVQENNKEAVKWFKLAAEQGDTGAQYNLGVMYTKGLGIKQDYNEAFRWFKLAAEQGNADAKEALKRLQSK